MTDTVASQAVYAPLIAQGDMVAAETVYAAIVSAREEVTEQTVYVAMIDNSAASQWVPKIVMIT